VGTLASRSRLLAITIGLLLGSSFLMLQVGPSAGAQERPSPDAPPARGACPAGCVDVVAVNGLIDDIEADFIVDSIRSARRADGVVAVVLQIDSGGVAVGDARFTAIARAVRDAEVPVSAWVGPSGSEALGGVTELVAVTTDSGIAPGARIGGAGPQRLSVATFGELLIGPAAVAVDEVLAGQAAVDAGVVDRFSPTIGDHIVNLPGVRTTEVDEEGQRRLVPESTVRFSKLPLFTQLFHTVASPSVAYLLLAAGLGLLLFEFFTAGVGVAGVVGAMCALLAAYGVAALPHRGWALGLVLAAMVAFAVDVQTGIPRAWTAIGMAAFTIGSLFLFTDFRPTWIALVAGIAGIAVTMFSGMPAMVRTRFATPTIGREWMIGQMGAAVTEVAPEGTVRVADGLWRALTNRATPIAVGDEVRVVAIDGLVLEVEPKDGGAIDYRELRDQRKGSRSAAGGASPDPD
jgi:membrane-bound serine protease (ClpP class)